MARARAYRDGVVVAEDFSLTSLAEYLRDEDLTVWIDLGSPTEKDLALVAERLGLHELAVEDALQAHQRPKLDEYDTHYYLSAHAVTLDLGTYRLSKQEVGAFITDRAVVTVRPGDTFDVDEVVTRWDNLAHLAKNGVDFLVHGLLDYVVDSQFDSVETLDDRVESLEDTIFEERPATHDEQRQALELRRSLVTLRRVAVPLREAVNTLTRRMTGTPMGPYYQDVYDHVLRVSEWTESLRELIATFRETQLNIQGNRLNLIMKKVTGWAAIIAVPTAITGFYGQNIPFPGFGQPWGVVVSSLAIVVLGVGLYVMFKRRDWL